MNETECAKYLAQGLTGIHSSGNVGSDYYTTDSAQFRWGSCPSPGEQRCSSAVLRPWQFNSPHHPPSALEIHKGAQVTGPGVDHVGQREPKTLQGLDSFVGRGKALLPEGLTLCL